MFESDLIYFRANTPLWFFNERSKYLLVIALEALGTEDDPSA